MSTVVSLICLGPSFQKMARHFLLHGSLRPTNLEKNLKPWSWLSVLASRVYVEDSEDTDQKRKESVETSDVVR